MRPAETGAAPPREPAPEEPSARPARKVESRTARASPRIRARQRVHAAVTTIVPALGTAAAVAITARDGVRPFAIGLFVCMYIAILLGVTVGFHRLASHGSFEVPRWVRAILLGLGSMAAQGPVTYWVTNHRRHHDFADRAGDLHSPHADGARRLTGIRGLWHAHLGWSFDHDLTNVITYGKDLLRDPLISRLNRLYYPLVLAGLLAPAIGCGLVTGTAAGALEGLLWGGLVRLFGTYHAVASVNSLSHRFGHRPFETRDQSRNNAWIAIVTLGEGWHNNHHAFPTAAHLGFRWWQVDLSGLLVLLLERLSLAWSVRRACPAQRGEA
jgi:stearoyl-CoA desaturase (delta-9 desaturase)